MVVNIKMKEIGALDSDLKDFNSISLFFLIQVKHDKSPCFLPPPLTPKCFQKLPKCFQKLPK